MSAQIIVIKQPLRQFENSPLFKTNVKVLKFWGFILRYGCRRCVCLVPAFILTIGQFIGLFTSNNTSYEYIQAAFFCLLWLNGLLRTSSIIYQRNRYEDFMEAICTTHTEIQRTEGKELNQLSNETARTAQTIQVVNIIAATLTCFCIGLYPLFTDSRAHPYGVYIPWVNKLESPWFEIIYAYQFLVTMAPGSCLYLPFTSIVIVIFMFCTLMCKVLQYHLRNLNTLDPNEAWKEVVWCIRYHSKILRYVKLINSLTTYIYLLEFISFGGLLCGLLFLVVVVENMSQRLILCSYITVISSQIAAMYWLANELSDQSVGVAVAAYDSNWLDFDVRTRKALLLLIARAQKPCSILVGNVFPMSLEMFQSLLNATISYFTVLRRFYG